MALKNKIEKILLFGSCARGDFDEKSNVDIAISGGNAAEFCLMINEDVSTLVKFDIVCLDTPIQDELLSEIEKDEVIIYKMLENLTFCGRKPQKVFLCCEKS